MHPAHIIADNPVLGNVLGLRRLWESRIRAPEGVVTVQNGGEQSQSGSSVSELGRPLSMSLAAVVQHVQVLEASGLVRSQEVGRTRTCSINPAALRSAENWIAERRGLWERRLDRLGDFLADSARSTPENPIPSSDQPEEKK